MRDKGEHKVKRVPTFRTRRGLGGNHHPPPPHRPIRLPLSHHSQLDGIRRVDLRDTRATLPYCLHRLSTHPSATLPLPRWFRGHIPGRRREEQFPRGQFSKSHGGFGTGPRRRFSRSKQRQGEKRAQDEKRGCPQRSAASSSFLRKLTFREIRHLQNRQTHHDAKPQPSHHLCLFQTGMRTSRHANVQARLQHRRRGGNGPTSV